MLKPFYSRSVIQTGQKLFECQKVVRWLLAGSLFAMVACVDSGSQKVSGDVRGSSKTCRAAQGETFGPGVIGGQTLDQRGRIARSTLFVVTRETDTGATDEKMKVSSCTATYLGANWVLTAAHCVNDDRSISNQKRAEFSRLAFTVDPIGCVFNEGSSDGSRLLKLSNVIVHPDWTGTLGHADLALIQIEGPVHPEMQPVRLWGQDEQVPPSVFVAGYGKTQDWNIEEQDPDLRLRMTSLETDFQVSIGSEFLVLRTDQGRAICRGDSGGPAFAQLDSELLQVGVASYVTSNKVDSKDMTCLYRGSYTKVSKYKNWIQNQTQLENLYAP